jgi:hypothetical protein
MILFDIKGIVRKEFILAGQNSEFHIPLWSVMLNEWKFLKTSPRILATKDLAAASWQQSILHFFFSPENFLP